VKLCSTCNQEKKDGECQELHDKWNKATGDWQCADCIDRWRDMREAHQIDLEKQQKEGDK
jgi:hypothetical protein